MRKNLFKKITAMLFAVSIAISAMPAGSLRADEVDPIAPHEASYGYFIKSFKTNTNENNTVESNAAIALLSGYLDLWEPGDSWSTGKKLNKEVLDLNIATAYKISGARTEEQTDKAYKIEFHEQNFTVLYGLGDLTEKFFKQAGIVEQYAAAGPNNSKPIHITLSIMQQMRALPVSTSAAKNFYQYPRPYRWSSNGVLNPHGTQFYASNIVPAIVTEKEIAKLDAQTDGGFPSGHTNAVFICALGLAYAVPEKFADVVLYASDMGKYRIIAGMHSPLDVMGGRMTGTAFAASFLAGARASVKNNAIKENKTYLLDDYVYQPATEKDYEIYKKNLETYLYNMTYEFKQIGDTTEPMRVPYGAESLLESRYPYMTADEIRYVLYTTGLPSGYPLLDDEEGWGRLNLYAAANGYGSFVKDVTVNMDLEKGGLYAYDSWLNDIDGNGSLTVNGDGTLTLAGNNTYAGGTIINGGMLMAANANALGSGKVVVNSGVLAENVTGTANMPALLVEESASLQMMLASENDTIKVNGKAELNGTVAVELSDYTPAAGKYTILTADELDASKAKLVISGIDGGKMAVEGNSLVLTVENTAAPTETPENTEVPTPTTPPTGAIAEDDTNNTSPMIFVLIAVGAIAIIAVVVVCIVGKKKK